MLSEIYLNKFRDYQHEAPYFRKQKGSFFFGFISVMEDADDVGGKGKYGVSWGRIKSWKHYWMNSV